MGVFRTYKGLKKLKSDVEKKGVGNVLRRDINKLAKNIEKREEEKYQQKKEYKEVYKKERKKAELQLAKKRATSRAKATAKRRKFKTWNIQMREYKPLSKL